jgi:hypothetical protein
MTDLQVIPVALSPDGFDMIDRGLRKLREFLPTEEERQRCDKILDELRVAVSHAEPSVRSARAAGDDERRGEAIMAGSGLDLSGQPTPSEAEQIADKMAKAARKAVEE